MKLFLTVRYEYDLLDALIHRGPLPNPGFPTVPVPRLQFRSRGANVGPGLSTYKSRCVDLRSAFQTMTLRLLDGNLAVERREGEKVDCQLERKV